MEPQGPFQYFIREDPAGQSLGVWRFDEWTATMLGVANPKAGPGTYFQARDGEDIWSQIRHATPWLDEGNPFHLLRLPPGAYFPRMARPIDQHPHEAPGWSPGATGERDVVAVARSQLDLLARQLERLCQTVHPDPSTIAVFGHDIRNFLLLACTEVETHWRGVLRANGIEKARLGTSDYVVLNAAMKLDEYSVDFPAYPWLKPFRPFEGWGSTGRPTQELAWYDAYNAVKHNREEEFRRASLLSAFSAASACAIMMAAQYGVTEGLGRSSAGAFFALASTPKWKLGEVYVYPYDQTGWKPCFYLFQMSE